MLRHGSERELHHYTAVVLMQYLNVVRSVAGPALCTLLCNGTQCCSAQSSLVGCESSTCANHGKLHQTARTRRAAHSGCVSSAADAYDPGQGLLIVLPVE